MTSCVCHTLQAQIEALKNDILKHRNALEELHADSLVQKLPSAYQGTRRAVSDMADIDLHLSADVFRDGHIEP